LTLTGLKKNVSQEMIIFVLHFLNYKHEILLFNTISNFRLPDFNNIYLK